MDRMLADLHALGLAFCLPIAEAIAFIDGLHLGKASWTSKQGKASGRSIGDMEHRSTARNPNRSLRAGGVR
jgi:hypothetical protein